MIANAPQRNAWKIQPDTTVQVVDPHGIKRKDASRYSSRNWSGLCISLAIIAVVLICVTIAAAILVPLEVPPFSGRRIALSDLINPSLVAVPMGARWISDSEIIYASEENGIVIMNVVSNKTEGLLNSYALNQTKAVEFYLSENRRYLLLVHHIEKERLYRRSAKYSVYDVNNTHYYPLSMSPDSVHHPRYQHVQWLKDIRKSDSAPTNRSITNVDESGSELLIVDNNNIFYMPTPNGESFSLTENDNPNTVYLGVVDLVYEEILRKSHSLWPSPSGAYVAYTSFNVSLVEELPILSFKEDATPTVVPLRYSTVNGPIPDVTVWVQEVAGYAQGKKQRKWKIVPPPGMPKEHYFLGADWVNDHKLWISWVSRDQSTSMLATYEATEWDCSLLDSKYVNTGIIPIVQNVVWSGNWAAFPWPDTARKGSWHSHVAQIGVKEGRHVSRTLDGYHVIKILASALDSSTSDHLIYFLGSSLTNGNGDQQLYESSEKGRISCISCHLGCFRVTASLNEALSYALIRCQGIPFTSVHIIHIQMETSFALHTQQSLRKSMEDIALPKIITRDVSLSSDLHASVTLSLPPSWSSTDDSFSFPLVIQSVGIEDYDIGDSTTHLGWPELLTSGHEVAHARIKILERVPSERISTRTMAAYVQSVISFLLKEYDFLSSKQVFGWGWGSGASVAIELSAMNPSAYGCVAAINPVYNWGLYASFWAERMLGPSRGRCYEESHLARAVEGLNRTKVMLIQSMADPLSHHSAHVASMLIKRNIQFKHVVYPESSHSLKSERRHFFKSMQEFFLNENCIHIVET